MLLVAAALRITGCAQQTFTVQNKPAAVASKKPSPIISSLLELGRRKLSMQLKFEAAENVVKQKPQQTFVNGFIGLFFRLYNAGSACIAHNMLHELLHRYGNSICTAH